MYVEASVDGADVCPLYFCVRFFKQGVKNVFTNGQFALVDVVLSADFFQSPVFFFRGPLRFG